MNAHSFMEALRIPLLLTVVMWVIVFLMMVVIKGLERIF